MDDKEITNVKKYDPNVDVAGYAHVPVGQRVEQVKNGGPGSGNFGHSGRPGEVGGSGEGGGSEGSKIRVSIPDNEGGASYHELRGYRREKAEVPDVTRLTRVPTDRELEDHTRIGKVQTMIREREAKGEISRAAADKMVRISQEGDHAALVKLDKTLSSNVPLHPSGVPGGGKSGGLIKTGTPLKEGMPDVEAYYHKEYNPETDRPGTAFVPHGQKTEMVTNPPYVTPELGDAPEEMQKEADRIYKDLRKNQYHAETEEDRAAASGTMWKILKSNWEKNEKTGKWQRKKRE